MRYSAVAALRGNGSQFLLSAEQTHALARAIGKESGLPDALPAPDELAVALGYSVIACTGLPPGPQLYVAGCVLYRATDDRQERLVRIAHSLAHSVLTELGAKYSEADAWRLAVELVAPNSGSDHSIMPEWLWTVAAPHLPVSV